MTNRLQGQESLETFFTIQGIAQMYQGNYQNAIDAFDNALKTSPKSIVALQGRAFCRSMTLTNTSSEDYQELLSDIVSDLSNCIDSLNNLSLAVKP